MTDMTPAALARPRDASGRVLMPIACEGKLVDGGGFRRYYSSLEDVMAWLSGAEFRERHHRLRSVKIIFRDHGEETPADTMPEAS
jgi:hypothetical protein